MKCRSIHFQCIRRDYLSFVWLHGRHCKIPALHKMEQPLLVPLVPPKSYPYLHRVVGIQHYPSMSASTKKGCIWFGAFKYILRNTWKNLQLNTYTEIQEYCWVKAKRRSRQEKENFYTPGAQLDICHQRDKFVKPSNQGGLSRSVAGKSSILI